MTVINSGQDSVKHETTQLFRPVGQAELDLIKASGNKAFPPRLPEQPIFYPVLNEEYAAAIAREWNARREPDKVGYVTRFQVRTEFLQRYQVQTVGGTIHQEYWIPAEDLPEFNENIVGEIEVIAVFREGVTTEIVRHSKQGMIVKEQVMPLLLTACPSFTDRWNNYQNSFKAPLDEPLLYIDLEEFASHLIELLGKERVEEFADVFDVVERLHLEGEPFVKEAATMGLLESLQNRAVEPAAFVKYLGPESKKGWRKLNEFWGN